MKALLDILKENSYPGRGILVSKSQDGKKAVTAYFIMGRSENSRNRFFTVDEDGINIMAADKSKITDPSLIFYSPVRIVGTKQIITNGVQTEAVYTAIKSNTSVKKALEKFTYEPDSPNYTPRISAVVEPVDMHIKLMMSLIRKADDSEVCERTFFDYSDLDNGTGKLIHTYAGDGHPLPPFSGEPKTVCIESENIDLFTQNLWCALDENNRISLFVRFTDICDGSVESRIINKSLTI